MTDHPLPADLLVDVAPLTDDDLARYFDWDEAEHPFDQPETEPVAHRWQIDGSKTADWAMAKYAAAEAELAELAERRDEYVTRIGAWFDHGAKTHQRTLDFFGGHLERYAIGVRVESGGKTKSLTMPNGVVKTTESKPKAVVAIEADVLGWAIDHLPAAVATKQSIRLTELREGVELREVPTRVVLSPCACVVPNPIDDADSVAELDKWGRAAGVTCPACGDDALVGDWLETTFLVVDKRGVPVPGTAVAEGSVTAKVIAG